MVRIKVHFLPNKSATNFGAECLPHAHTLHAYESNNHEDTPRKKIPGHSFSRYSDDDV